MGRPNFTRSVGVALDVASIVLQGKSIFPSLGTSIPSKLRLITFYLITVAHLSSFDQSLRISLIYL